MSNLSPVCRNVLRSPRLSNCPLSGVTPIFRADHRRFHASPSNHDGDKRYPHINTDSLADTLESHRTANRPPSSPLIVKYYEDGKNKDGKDRATKQTMDKNKRSDYRPGKNKKKKGKPRPNTDGQKDQREGGPERRRRLRYERRERDRVTPNLKGLSWKVNWHKGQTHQSPWLDYLDSPAPNGSARLNQEIDAFEKYMSEIPQETAAVQKAQQEIAQVLARAGIPEPVLFGSRQTGMAVRHSDLELLIPVHFEGGRSPSTQEQAQKQLANQLHSVAVAFDASDAFCYTTSRTHGRVPCVRANHTDSGLTISIHSGATLLSSSEHVLSYAREFPTLRRLFIVLRMALEIHGLFGVSNHSVGPYSLAMMIVAALKMGEGAYDQHDAGQQLLYILRFYADLDSRNYGVSVDPPSIFRKAVPRKESELCPPAHVRGQMSIGRVSAGMREMKVGQDASELKRGNLCLQDPTDYMNDLGKVCMRTAHLKNFFRRIHIDMQKAICAWDAEEKPVETDGASVPQQEQDDGVQSKPEEEKEEKEEEEEEGEKKEETEKKKKKPTETNKERKNNMRGSRPTDDLRPTTEELIKKSDNKHAIGLLQYPLAANYDSLERLRDKTILGSGG